MTKLFLAVALVLLVQDSYSLVPKDRTSAEQVNKIEDAKSSKEIPSVAAVVPAVASDLSAEVVNRTSTNKQKTVSSNNEEMIIDQVHDPAVVDYGMPPAPPPQQEDDSWEDYYEEDSSEEDYRYVYEDAAYAQPLENLQPQPV